MVPVIAASGATRLLGLAQAATAKPSTSSAAARASRFWCLGLAQTNIEHIQRQ
jgi:hypothetical protein